MLFLDKQEKFFKKFQTGFLKHWGSRVSVEGAPERGGLGDLVSFLMSASLTLQHSVIYFSLFSIQLQMTLQSCTEFVGQVLFVLFLSLIQIPMCSSMPRPW